MPLITCPDCGKQVSDQAPQCPGCGRPIVPPRQTVEAAPPDAAAVTKDWQDCVLKWRLLPAAARERYWKALTPEQQEKFRSVNAALPPAVQSPVATQGVATSGMVVCPNPNCGYQGPPNKVARGSVAVGCVLCLFFLLPGILYFIFKSGYRYLCPKCGLQLRSDN